MRSGVWQDRILEVKYGFWGRRQSELWLQARDEAMRQAEGLSHKQDACIADLRCKVSCLVQQLQEVTTADAKTIAELVSWTFIRARKQAISGCWLLVAGCWLLDAGCWMLDAASSRTKTRNATYMMDTIFKICRHASDAFGS